VEIIIQTVADLQITGRTAFNMTENSKFSLKLLSKELIFEILMEMMRLSQDWSIHLLHSHSGSQSFLCGSSQ